MGPCVLFERQDVAVCQFDILELWKIQNIMFEWKVWMRFNNFVGRGLVDLRSHPKGKTDQIHNDLYWLKAVSGWCWNQNTCICIRNLSFLLGMLPVTVTTKDDIRTSLVQVGLPKSLYFLLPSWEWWLVSPVFAPKFFKSSIFTSILGWRDGGIDPPTLTARRWWLGAGRSDPWELGSFKKCGGWGPNLFTKKPGAVFEAQPDSGRKAGGKMKHPNWNRNFELWTMLFLGWNFLVVYKLHLRVWGFKYSVVTAWKHVFFGCFCVSQVDLMTCWRRLKQHLCKEEKVASVSESQTPWQSFGIFLKGLLGCDIGGAKEPGVIYFPTNWGAKEPQNLPNHRVGFCCSNVGDVCGKI